MTDLDLDLDLERAFRFQPSAASAAAIDSRVARAMAAGRTRPGILGRLSWLRNRRLVIVALGALALMGAAYTLSLIEQAARLMPGWQVAYERGDVIGQTETSGGYAVTLERAYSDPNQLVLAFTVAGPSGAIPGVASGIDVLDDAGRHYLEFAGGSFSNRQVVASASVDSFDVPPATPGPVHLRAIVDGLTLITTDPAAGSVAGRWAFEFETSMRDARTVAPNTSATARAVPITVDWVRFSATAIRVHLLVDLATIARPGTRWVAEASIASHGSRQALDWTPLPTGWTGQPKAELQSLLDGQDGSDQVFQTEAGLDDPSGTWTVRVERLVGYDGSGERTTIDGPWTLRFTVP